MYYFELHDSGLPFSVFLNISWSTSFRFLDNDSTSGGILLPKNVKSLEWPEDMTHLRNCKLCKQHVKIRKYEHKCLDFPSDVPTSAFKSHDPTLTSLRSRDDTLDYRATNRFVNGGIGDGGCLNDIRLVFCCILVGQKIFCRVFKWPRTVLIMKTVI